MYIPQQILDDYPEASVTLVTLFDRSLDHNVKSKLIFAKVDLYPVGVPAEKTSQLFSKKIQGNSKQTIYLRTVNMKTDDAVTWHLQSGDIWKTPFPNDMEVSPQTDGRPILIDKQISVPEWPLLSISGSSNILNLEELQFTLPFLEPWQNQPRNHCRFSTNRTFAKEIVSKRDIRIWLAARLQFDLVEYEEFLGGSFLVAPDPLVRSVGLLLLYPESSARNQEASLLTFDFRPGMTSEQLLYQVTFACQTGIVEQINGTLTDQSFIEIPASIEIDRSAIQISCEKRGVLLSSPLTSFLRQMQLTTGIASSRKEIHAPENRKRDAEIEKRKVTDYAKATEGMIIGANEKHSSKTDLFPILASRNRLRLADSLDQVWLDDPKQAREIIRSLISKAQTRVWIFDPYFSDLEMLWFIHDVPNHAALNVLTSREIFEVSDEAKLLISVEFQTKQIIESRNSGAFDFRVLSGSPPKLHDRFLVVDHKVWLIGNSFGTAGSREGVMINLPDAQTPIERLSKLFASAESFFEFKQRRWPLANQRRAAPNYPTIRERLHKLNKSPRRKARR